MTEYEERYVRKDGKFGAYFYDLYLGKDIDLEQIKVMLNQLDRLLELGRALGGPER